MNHPLIVICGPTATGKTALGVRLAKKFNGEIISADSRQVYKGMDIGTGKDWDDEIQIYCYDIADPKSDFSVSQYLKFARKSELVIRKKGKLPIIVGGTGFYIKGITDGIPTAEIPRNNDLRKQLEDMPAEKLFESLSLLDSVKAGGLNASDKQNPRRLVRAIEIAQYLLDHPVVLIQKNTHSANEMLFIGLTAPKERLFNLIETRVDLRVSMGVKQEIEKLLKMGITWEDQSMLSMGYRQYRDFFEGGVEEDQVINEWKKEERKYAVRQMVWFKKDKRINWFDVTDPEYAKKVENMIEKWDNKANVQKN